VKHRDLIDRIEDAAGVARTALIEGDDLAALAAAHLMNNYATQLTRALYDDEAAAYDPEHANSRARFDAALANIVNGRS
jgi:hypothetical protein